MLFHNLVSRMRQFLKQPTRLRVEIGFAIRTRRTLYFSWHSFTTIPHTGIAVI